jgi:hypothetical protein
MEQDDDADVLEGENEQDGDGDPEVIRPLHQLTAYIAQYNGRQFLCLMMFLSLSQNPLERI